MEESFGAQFALQVALQTLKERCQQFQQRISTLEEENALLKSKNESNFIYSNNSLSEFDVIKQKNALLVEENEQLTNNFHMILLENRSLWSRLSKLGQTKENLESKLHKISDSLYQHTVSLTQHQTFVKHNEPLVQSEANRKITSNDVAEDNSRISLELENISLKLMSTIAKEKLELENQCSQLAEIQNTQECFINSLAFTYPIIEIEEAALEEFQEQFMNLNEIKSLVLRQRENLKQLLSNVISYKEGCPQTNIKFVAKAVQTIMENEESKSCTDLNKLCSTTNNDKFEVGESSMEMTDNVRSNQNENHSKNEMICPMCNKIFPSSYTFVNFQEHVESHFKSDGGDNPNFEFLP